MKIAVNGFDMNYEIDGPDGAPWLTFANSLVTSLEMWDEQARALKDRYRVLRFDMRGHGQSGAPRAALYDRGAGERRAGAVGRARGRPQPLRRAVARRHDRHSSRRAPPGEIPQPVATDCRADANEAYQGVFVERIRVTREHGMAGMVEPTLARFFTPAFVAANPRPSRRCAR